MERRQRDKGKRAGQKLTEVQRWLDLCCLELRGLSPSVRVQRFDPKYESRRSLPVVDNEEQRSVKTKLFSHERR